jgi:glutamate--cysteine ligase catalytic subunit
VKPVVIGGQIEYLVVSFDEENKTACLSLRQAEILEALAEDAKLQAAGGGVSDSAK